MANEIRAQDLVQGIDPLTQDVLELSNAIKTLREEMTKGQKAFDSRSKSQSDLTKKSKELSVVDKELIKLDKQMATAEAKLTNEYKQVAKATLQKKEAARLANEELKKEIGLVKKRSGLFKGMVKSLASVAAGYLGIQTAIRGLSNSVKLISSFQKSMDEVVAITDATNEEFSLLKENALELGAATSKTAVEVSGLQKEFAKLGFSTDEILAATEATIDLSIAAGSDLAGSAVVAASTVRGFGLAASDTQRVVDVMAKSFSSSALDLDKFKTAMATAAPVAKASGKDIEFVTARLGILADAGLDASTAGTSLRNMFLELNKQGLTWEEGLEKINTSTNKNVTALELFGKRGATAALILAENTDKAGLLEAKLDNAAGTAKKMADIMENNLAGDVAKASSAFQGLILNIGKNAGILRTLTQGVTRFVTNINNSLKPLKEQANLYQLQDKELTSLFSSIQNTNLSQEARNKLIATINDKYGEYLPNLLTEKSTLEEIEEAEKAINKQLKLKIIQQAFQEEITELVQKELKAKEQLVNNEIAAEELVQQRIQSAGKLSKQEQDNAALFLEIGNNLSKSIIENNAEEISNTEEKFKRIGELYGIAFEEIEAILNENEAIAEESNNNIIEADKKKYKKLLENAKKFGADLKAENAEATDEYIKSVGLFQDEIEAEIENQLRLEQEAVEDTIQAEIEARRAAAQEAIDLQKEIAEKQKELGAEAEKAAVSIVTGIYSAGVDERLAKFSDAEEAKQDTLKNQLDKGLLTEEQYEKKLAASKLKVRQEEAKAEKKKALFEIAIATAVAAVQALPAIPLVALVLAIGAVQAAVVASKPLPKYEEGEVNISAKRHSQGGKDINIEGGESIINRTGTSNAPTLLEYINSGLISDSDLLPSSGKMFAGADTKELLQGNEGSVIGLEPLIREQRETNRTLSKLNITNMNPDHVEKINIKTGTKKTYIDKWMRG